MASFENDTIELKGLDQIFKALKIKPPTIRLGILGGKDGRKDGGSNATIGAVHEFGSPANGISQRSFLRVPIADNLQKDMQYAGLLDEKTIKDVIKDASVVPWLKKVAVVADGIVFDAFETKGFGKWPPWKDPNYTNEGGTLLVDTQQLRDSITWDIK